MQDNNFSLQETQILKGIAIVIIAVHHVFWNSFFVSGSNQIFLIHPVTITLCKYGYICNHIFAALSGYAISFKFKRIKCKFKLPFDREFSLLTMFLPVSIIVLLLYWMIMKQSPLSAVYSNNFAYLITDITGLADLFKTPILNPTWWYMSVAHLINIVVPFLLIAVYYAFKKRIILQNIALLVIWSGTLLYLYKKPELYICVLFAALNGALIERLNIINKIESVFEKVCKNKFEKIIINSVILSL